MVLARRLSVLLVASCCAAVLTGAGRAGVLTLDTDVKSVALHGVAHALIVLPADYATHPHERYPVVYFLHGLPAGAGAYRSNGWLTELVAKIGSFILVEAQGARAGDSDPEYLDWGGGRNWSTYETQELPHYVDAHFRTIRSRSGRAIVGLSAGGYGAAMLGLSHLGEFSAIESWSGYFHATDPTGKSAIAAPLSANVHRLIEALPADERTRPTFLAFYVGRSDPIFVAENEQLDRELTAERVPHVFALYPGGHEQSLWLAHATAWLRLCVAHLARPQPS